MIDKIKGNILNTDLDSSLNEILFSILANKTNEIIDVLNRLTAIIEGIDDDEKN